MQGELIRAGEEFPFETDDGDEFVFRDLDGELIADYTVTTKIAGTVVPISGIIAETQAEEARIVDTIATVTGILSENDAMNSYSFEAEADVEYAIYLTSEDFDAYLHLYNADGEEIAFNDDGGGDLNALIVYKAPEDGLYTVGIDSFQDGAQGSYTLSISHPTTTINGFLAAGKPTDTSIDVEEDMTYFVIVTSDVFDTILTVLDENGNEAAVNDDRGDGTTNSFVWFTAASSGSYTIQVSSFDGTGTGDFVVLIGSFVAAE